MNFKKQLGFLSFVFILLLAQQAVADTSLSLFHEANRFYNEGRFEKAIEKYKEIILKGKESGNLYFNLGNAYAKTRSKGQAILNYQRALRFIPKDAELNYNLRFIESQLEDKVIPKKQNRAIQKYWSFVGQLTEKNWILIFLMVFLLLFIIALSHLIWRKRRREMRRLFIGILVVWICVSSFVAGKVLKNSQDTAIVLSKEVVARYGPSGKDVAAFTLHEGTFCEVLGSSNGWFQIRLLDGKVAWLPKSSIESI